MLDIFCNSPNSRVFYCYYKYIWIASGFICYRLLSWWTTYLDEELPLWLPTRLTPKTHNTTKHLLPPFWFR